MHNSRKKRKSDTATKDSRQQPVDCSAFPFPRNLSSAPEQYAFIRDVDNNCSGKD